MAGKHPKFQTVEWWIDQLKMFNPKATVHIATERGDERAMASIYYDDPDCNNKTNKVWIDIE